MRLVSVVGTRPDIIQSIPVSKAIRAKGHHEILVNTGQHYDHEMAEIFFAELSVPTPDYDLGVGSGSHGRQTGQMLERIEELLLAEKPDWVLVRGDTNSTLAGALAAAKLHVPVAHVEAGMRSFNRKMPEEINRILTDHISTLCFCSTATAVQNLKAEGITKGVRQVGDVQYDLALQTAALAEARSKVLERLAVRPGAYLLATVHRAENTDDPARLTAIAAALNAAQERIVFPLHPRTREAIKRLDCQFAPHVQVIEPVGYMDMTMLERHARMILTDSGGVQKEAYFFGVPCVSLRDETEWVETVEAGWNVLAGANTDAILNAVRMFKPGGARQTFFGDGRASERIADILTKETAHDDSSNR